MTKVQIKICASASLVPLSRVSPRLTLVLLDEWKKDLSAQGLLDFISTLNGRVGHDHPLCSVYPKCKIGHNKTFLMCAVGKCGWSYGCRCRGRPRLQRVLDDVDKLLRVKIDLGVGQGSAYGGQVDLSVHEGGQRLLQVTTLNVSDLY